MPPPPLRARCYRHLDYLRSHHIGTLSLFLSLPFSPGLSLVEATNIEARFSATPLHRTPLHHGAPEFLKQTHGEFAFIFVDDEHGSPARTLVTSEIKAFHSIGWQPEWDVAATASGATA
ncbi:asparagine synthase [Colletotrichum incanum]|uniref:Asparagine synthase n=1 Tax=Colletotrichum incanum TaxID=1573173 RepID=A0A162MYL1_COLIC|nr:asparagine synthase [Colletotrichum incanum]